VARRDGRHRGDDRRGHDAARGARRDRRVRDGRNRRRPPRRGGDDGRVRRPDGAGDDAGRGRVGGIKSILDIGLSLERLETLGVPVVVNGSDDFPAFYSRRSGFAAPRRLDGSDEIAALMHSTWDVLGMEVGISIANPVPAVDEIPAEEIDTVITEAIAEMDARHVVGQAVTPFLLSRLVERTGGRTLTANVALVRSNAVVATEIALAYAARRG
jgi:pseudouridine-5'-phosphate glycosidase